MGSSGGESLLGSLRLVASGVRPNNSVLGLVLHTQLCSRELRTGLAAAAAAQALESLNEFERERELTRRYEEFVRERQREELLNRNDRRDGKAGVRRKFEWH